MARKKKSIKKSVKKQSKKKEKLSDIEKMIKKETTLPKDVMGF